ncbi:MAG: hypothetical protein Q6364_02810 [Candidatus Hermodarchaeota archaeon]|nr:hypothetical protein [Candidatus Hermodarchaeota archaeon]
MYASPPTFPFLLIFIVTSFVCVNYSRRYEKGWFGRDFFMVLGLVSAQFLVGFLFVYVYSGLVWLFGAMPIGGGEIVSDTLMVISFTWAFIWATLVVNFAYLIWTKPTAIK